MLFYYTYWLLKKQQDNTEKEDDLEFEDLD
jgi:hypothetical protein